MSKFANLTLDIVSDDGGSNRVTIPATLKIRGGTGDDGATSVPCREAILSCPSGSSTVRVTIGTDCTLTTGIKVPEQAKDKEHAMYLRIPIDDLNNLYFFGAESEVCDILYRK